jgi:hypothetical protein
MIAFIFITLGLRRRRSRSGTGRFCCKPLFRLRLTAFTAGISHIDGMYRRSMKYW